MTSGIGYVLKGYPRMSELFIASEIHRLEKRGLELGIFVIKPPDEQRQHAVVDRIQAAPHYLPTFGSVSDTTAARWLRENVPIALPALMRLGSHRPMGLLGSARLAFAQAVRSRRSRWDLPRKLYLKEFFQAVVLADAVRQQGTIHHLHAHFCHGATTVTWLAAGILGLTFSFTAHAKDIYQAKLNPAGLLARKLRAARFATTCTEANRKHLEALCPEAEVHRVYHGLNADFERLLEENLPSPAANQEFEVLSVGRRVPKKGFDTLVSACAVARERGRPWTLRLVGEEGDASDALRSLVRELQLEDLVAFEGPVLQNELLTRMRHADALVLPCRIVDDGDRDGIPNVLVEAMAAGTPVISTPISGIPELVVDGQNGLLVEPDRPAALADAIDRLIDDPANGTRLARAGQRSIAERFDANGEVTRLQALLCSTLEAST